MPPRSPNTLAGPYLERAAHRRKDEAHVQAVLADPRTLFVPVWQTRNSVLRQGELLTAHFVTGIQALGAIAITDYVWLGEFRGQAVLLSACQANARNWSTRPWTSRTCACSPARCRPTRPGCWHMRGP